MSRTRSAALLFALGLLSSSASAAEKERAARAADFSEVCTAALLHPGELDAASKARGLSRVEEAVPWGGAHATLYAADGAERTVTVTRHHFSDLDMTICLVSFPEPLSKDELAALRAKLESPSALGRLEGELVDAAASLRLGLLKRPGNAPIVTVNVTVTGMATTLVMNRWDPAPGK